MNITSFMLSSKRTHYFTYSLFYRLGDIMLFNKIGHFDKSCFQKLIFIF